MAHPALAVTVALFATSAALCAELTKVIARTQDLVWQTRRLLSDAQGFRLARA